MNAPTRRREPTRLGPQLGALALVVALTVCALAPFGRLFADSDYLVSAAVAAVLAACISGLLARVGPLLLSVVAHVVGLAAYLVFVVNAAGLPSGSELTDTLDGVTGSWNALLSATVPVISAPEFLVLPVVLAWVATAVAAELLSRTRLAAAVVVPGLVVFGVALVFTGRLPRGVPWEGFAVLLVSLGLVFLRRNVSDPTVRSAAANGHATAPASTWAFGVPIIVVVALAAAMAGESIPLVDDSNRFDLHSRYVPPVNEFDDVSPLSQLRPQLNDRRPEAEQVLFEVSLSGEGAADVDRVRVASLDSYDGAVFSSEGTFSKVGDELPPAPPYPQGVDTQQVRQSYELVDYPFRFLPAVSRPVELDGEDVVFDRDSASLLSSRDTPSMQGYTYEVESSFATANQGMAAGEDGATEQRLDGIPEGEPGQSQDFAVYALLPPGLDLSEVDRFLSRSGVRDSGGRLEQLSALEAALRSTDFGYRTDATPGHNSELLGRFLTAPTGDDPDLTGRIGYAEQSAAAFAVAARLLGHPSRVVVGYLLPDRGEQDDGQEGAGDEGGGDENAEEIEPIAVRTTDAHAWAEVHINGVGWVGFDPTNRTERDPLPPETTTPPQTTPDSSSPTTEAVTPTTGEIDCAANPDLCPAAPESDVPWFPVAIAAVALLTPSTILVAKRVRRSRRRTRGSPADRVVGAWKEARDRLVSHRVRADRSRTAAEVASERRSENLEVANRLDELVPLLDEALYAPDEPPDDLVELAWKAESGVADAVRGSAGRFANMRAALNPRTLVGSGRK